MPEIYRITFDQAVIKTIALWKKSNPILYKKLNKILGDIILHPRTGLGHPEPMVGGGDTKYSRRISVNERIIYEIIDAEILVMVIEIGGALRR